MNFYLKSNRGQKSKHKKSKKYFWFLFSVVFLFIFLASFLFSAGEVFAVGTFSSKKLTISDSRESQSDVIYTFEWSGAVNTLRCIQILFCNEPPWGSCITPDGFDSTGTSKGTWTGLTSANWNLDNTLNGTFQITNAAGEAPAANVSLEFLGFTNPANTGTYHARITTYSDISCTTQIDWGPVPFSIIGEGVKISATVPSPPPPTATIIFEGKTSPFAFITFLKNGSVAGTTSALSSGLFQKTLSGLIPGIYTFGIFVEDKAGRTSSTVNFTLNLASGTTMTISGILSPPTISLSPAKLERGKTVSFSGETFPKSQITLFVSPGNITKKTTADLTGKWLYKLDTSSLKEGKYSVKSKAVSPQGEQSNFSKDVSFTVLPKEVLPTPPGLPVVPPIVPPEGPIVSSLTHPDPEKWYCSKDLVLSFQKEEGVTGFSYVLDQEPLTVPDDISEGQENEISFKDIEDGIWYFHIKAKKDGKWGKVTHFFIKNDCSSPKDLYLFLRPAFKIPLFKFLLTIKNNPLVLFGARDELSGIDYYILFYKGASFFGKEKVSEKIEKAESPYALPSFKTGRYLIKVRVFDKAGNFQEKSQKVFIISIWLIIIIVIFILPLAFYLFKKLKRKG